MAEYSKIARGSFISTGNAQIISLPFQPTLIKLTNYNDMATSATSSIPSAWWDVDMGQGTAACLYLNAAVPPLLQAAVVNSGGFSTFSQGLALQYGPKIQIASSTKASSTFTTASAHGYSSGDVVIFQGLYQSAASGMAQICGIPFTITVTGATTFTIDWNLNQSNYTNLSGSPAGATVMKVLNPYLYVPGLNFISGLSVSGTTLTVTTAAAHNFVVGQEVAFRIPIAYGSIELNSLPNTQIPGSPIYAYVITTPSATTFTVSLVPFGGSITAFNSNQPITSVPGLQFPQVIAAGDINTGGWPYTGGALYPSPLVSNGVSTYPTINGPAIQGAFINNTKQGFVIGNGNAVFNTTPDVATHLCGTNGDLMLWEAFFTDFGS